MSENSVVSFIKKITNSIPTLLFLVAAVCIVMLCNVLKTHKRKVLSYNNDENEHYKCRKKMKI